MPSQVRVVVRTRPTDAMTDDIRVVSDHTLRLTRPAPPPPAPTAPQETTTFHADAVLHNSSQEAAYAATAADLVESTLQGLNSTLLCYGQSGAGKTYTLFGGEAYPTRGCVPRAIHAFFDTIATSTEREFKVTLTFVEVHGEQLSDLLGRGAPAAPARPAGKSGSANKASVFIDGSGTVVLRGIEKRECNSEAEALAAVFEGLQRRLCSPSPLNPLRSRSHALLTLYVVSKSLVDSDAVIHHSQCNFVDLAGSDRPHSLADETVQQETKIINRSLMMLEQVVFALSGNRPRHVPYRQSKLTMLLKDSIGGTCRTTLVANIWPEQRHMEATLATLNFAKRMVRIESNPTSHVSMDPEAHIRMLQKQVTSLKSELRMQDQLAGREAIATAPLESDEIQRARERVAAFVDGSTPQVRVGCVREMNACFLAFKALLSERDAQAKEAERQLTSMAHHRPDSGASVRSAMKQKNNAKHMAMAEKRDQVKILSSVTDGTTGVGVGTTDKPSSGLRDMLLQQSRSFPSGQTAIALARNKNTDEATTPTSSQPAAMDQVTPTAASKRAIALPTEGDVGKGGWPRPQPPSGPQKETQGSTFPPIERDRAVPTAAVKLTKGQEAGFRDKRVAFEAYKRTSTGLCQLETIKNTQKLIEEKNAFIAELQKRANEIRADIEANKPSGPSGLASLMERVVPQGGPLSEAVGMSLLLSSSISSSNVQNIPSGEALSAVPSEDFRNMSYVDKKAFLNLVTTAETRAVTERGILTKQLNRHYEAFMNNFQHWHNSHLQPTASRQGERAADVETISVQKGLISPFLSPQRAARQAEPDVRFMDGVERFEDMEMRRRVQKEPESVTFYAAQKFVRRGH